MGHGFHSYVTNHFFSQLLSGSLNSGGETKSSWSESSLRIGRRSTDAGGVSEELLFLFRENGEKKQVPILFHVFSVFCSEVNFHPIFSGFKLCTGGMTCFLDAPCRCGTFQRPCRWLQGPCRLASEAPESQRPCPWQALPRPEPRCN